MGNTIKSSHFEETCGMSNGYNSIEIHTFLFIGDLNVHENSVECV